ncbi:MAG: Ldh family oxidoreductase, partial [Clostridia bacterium]|nr:Ldh family oxidoreductase [Clostridia bacterium]
GMDFKAEPEIITEGASFALMDAHAGMGMVAGYKAMELAIKKAKETGVALVTVRNSTHFGAAGFYSNLAAHAGMFGLAVSNVDPNMTVPGARGMILGNNPLSYASPLGKDESVFLDIAMSNVASLKVVQAKKDGVKIPDTWIVDKDGVPTTDPSHYPEEGAMQPFGAHKGYGLAVMTELLTGVLSGGAIGSIGEIKSWCFDPNVPNNVCHTFIAVDVDKFCGLENYLSRSEKLVGALHSAPKAKGFDRIYMPGEIEWTKHEKWSDTVELPDAVASSLKEMSADLGISHHLVPNCLRRQEKLPNHYNQRHCDRPQYKSARCACN